MGISTAFPASRVARGVAIKTIFRDLRAGQIQNLPQRIAIIAQGSTAATFSTDKKQITTAGEVGEDYGYGSPAHLIAKQLYPVNGDGVGSIPVTLYPLDDDGSGVAAAGDVTPGGTPTTAASYTVKIGEVESEPFVISVGDVVADVTAAMTEAINAVLDMPVVAVDSTTKVDITSKWKGTSANGIVVEVVGSTTAGNTFAITQPTGGLVNPDVDDALNQVGDVWETLVINAMDIADTGTLDKLSTFGEGRWDADVRKPIVAFTGNTIADPVAATAVSAARTTDRVNAQSVLPGSNELPFVVAGRTVARIAVRADNDPAYDYGSMQLTGLVAGADGDQWTSDQRDIAIKLGSSSVIIRDGVPNIGDTVTFYNPTSEPVPAYRYVVDIMKIMTILYNLDLIFNTERWDGKPLIPDDQPTANPNAKKPRMAVADVWLLIDALGLEAVISDPDFAKENTLAEIDSQNPKRLNVSTTMKLSGNSNVISVDFNFGFYFGVQQVIA
jgi:phage tail sheath gpL-like